MKFLTPCVIKIGIVISSPQQKQVVNSESQAMSAAVIVGHHQQTKQTLRNVYIVKNKKCNQNFPTTTVDSKHGKRYTRRIES